MSSLTSTEDKAVMFPNRVYNLGTADTSQSVYQCPKDNSVCSYVIKEVESESLNKYLAFF